MYPYIGMIGGIGVGYSAGYAWQTVFNTFGALSIASGLFGAGTAVALRIIFNVMGSVYTVVCDRFLDFLRKERKPTGWVRWHKISRSPGSVHSLCRDKACGRLPEWQIPWYDFCQILRLRMSWLHESVPVRIIQECAGYHPEGQTSKAEPPPYPCREIQTGILLRPSGRLLLFRLLPCKTTWKVCGELHPRHHVRKYHWHVWKVDIPMATVRVCNLCCVYLEIHVSRRLYICQRLKSPVRGSVDAICSSSRL